MNGNVNNGLSFEVQTSGGYRGRFAPTPSGPLHLGSLLTALAGFLHARSAGGRWLLRIDDLDVQRSRREHADTILRQLDAHGLRWDESVRWQSEHVGDYETVLACLEKKAALYRCTCTRAQLAIESLPGPDGPVYSGACRTHRALPSRDHGALRLQVGPGRVQLEDPWQGPVERDLQRDVGDFAVRRADGQFGYQLACVVDEAALRITDVVRGIDLIGSSLRQIHLQDRLGLQSPTYRHLPIVLDRDGRKLSKQNHAMPLRNVDARRNLMRCLLLLGQDVPSQLADCPVDEIMAWAIQNWREAGIPRTDSLAAPV